MKMQQQHWEVKQVNDMPIRVSFAAAISSVFLCPFCVKGSWLLVAESNCVEICKMATICYAIIKSKQTFAWYQLWRWRARAGENNVAAASAADDYLSKDKCWKMELDGIYSGAKINRVKLRLVVTVKKIEENCELNFAQNKQAMLLATKLQTVVEAVYNIALILLPLPLLSLLFDAEIFAIFAA